jgi:hypothetical protein
MSTVTPQREGVYVGKVAETGTHKATLTQESNVTSSKIRKKKKTR